MGREESQSSPVAKVQTASFRRELQENKRRTPREESSRTTDLSRTVGGVPIIGDWFKKPEAFWELCARPGWEKASAKTGD